MDHEAGQCGCGIGGNVDLAGFERVNGENIAMRLVALRWTGAAPGRRTEVGAALYRAFGQCGAVGCAGILGQFRDVSRDVDDYPMPPARTGRRIGVVQGHGKTFGTFGCSAPYLARATCFHRNSRTH